MEYMFHYFIPDDGDNSEHFNIFPLPKVESIKLEHIEKNFPLPGRFHFRFKTSFEGTYVWMDLASPQDVVPRYEGLIISKVARIIPQDKNSTDNPMTEQRNVISTPGPEPPTKDPSLATPVKKVVENLIEDHEEATTGATTVSPPKSSAINDDLVDLLSTPSRPITPPMRPITPQQSTMNFMPSQPQSQQNTNSSYHRPMGSTPMSHHPNMNMMNGMARPSPMIPNQQNSNTNGQQPNFQGLQWQGMRPPQQQQQQQQPRGPIPPTNQQQQHRW